MEADDLHILVVDDEARVRQAVRRVMEPDGARVSEAVNGREGLAALQQDAADLVLVDLMMPVMDGMEFLEQARRLYPHLAVVVITGYATLEKAVAAMKQGADDFLAKPFKPKELRLVVERLVKQVRTLRDMAIEKSRTRALVDAMSNGVMVTNAEGRVVLTNPSLRRAFGLVEDQVIDKPLEQALPCPEVVETMGRVLAQSEGDYQAVTCQTTGAVEGDEVFLQVTCVPFVDGRGLLVGALAVFDDVTAWRRLDALKNEFVSTVAHEIASPLSAVLGQLQVLGQELPGPLNPKQAHLVERARARVTGIINLSKDLLDLAKIEAGALGEPEEVDLAPLLEEAVDLLAERARQKDQTLRLEAEGPLPKVMGVAPELLEVLVNLVSNAVKYTPDGGEITVTARSQDNAVVIQVSDTGLGLTPEEAAKIFDRFYRVKNQDTRHIVGTGLGLDIVKRVVNKHGGHIAVDSQPGQGSTFTVTLPALGQTPTQH